ncbi:MAG: tRNA (5-methylaminomethyl-2-thiouridine)(34)-methyltransferase MnmD [Bacteroidales bacterium]|jgi:tRNA U34 5-methylaminomethyl-2-thiouridine-forming methyltransferase MnmC|nr:tRNA (5-methylaminomethyl-2-thiouridine)(34)-methyltransferase MnmD [Bacteroidales bacterium]
MDNSIENNIEIIKTLDGSYSLQRNDIEETYHSVFGARNESEHIFINAGIKQIEKPNINVLEIGFGTGLNAILTLLYAKENKKKIFYQAIEKYPLEEEIISKLNYGEILDNKDLFLKIHSSKWGNENRIDEFFLLKKIFSSAQSIIYPDNFFDIVYFDAFSPEKEPSLWEKDIIQNMYNTLKQGGIFITYCCKGQVKRTLKECGFSLEKLPGPKGKREILRAEKK